MKNSKVYLLFPRARQDVNIVEVIKDDIHLIFNNPKEYVFRWPVLLMEV